MINKTPIRCGAWLRFALNELLAVLVISIAMALVDGAVDPKRCSRRGTNTPCSCLASVNLPSWWRITWESQQNGFTWEFWGEAMVWSKTVGDAASSVSMLSLTSIVGLEGRGKKWPSNCWHHCTKGIWWGFNSAEKQRDCSGLSRTGDAAFPKLGSCKQWLCETPSKHLMWLFLPGESKSQHILPFTYSVFDLLVSTSLHLKTAKISPESGPKSE